MRSPKDGETHASVASYNNHWGVPLSLARCPASAHYAVLEMGMNHAGEIEPLSRLARPHVAVITVVAPVHLEFFGTLAKIADAKAEIFLGLEPGGAAVLNRDNSQFSRLKRRAKEAGVARVVSFGEHEKADARLHQVRVAPRLLDRSGGHSRQRNYLQDRRSGPSSGVELAGGAGDSRAGRRRSGAGGAGACRIQAVVRARRADRDRSARRICARDRRKLQRQSGFGRGGARSARPNADRPARAAHCRTWRHARTWTARARAASRPACCRSTPTRSIWCSAAGR